MIVYQVQNVSNDKSYVGKTKRTLEQRWREHVHNAITGRKEMTLYAAIRKYGPAGFRLNILAECDDEDVLNQLEKNWIRDLGTFGMGYNMTLGGEGPKGYRHTAETKRRMSEFRKGRKFGPRTPEQCRNISRGKMGTGTGPRPHVKGRHHTEEARKKISESQYVRVAQYDMLGNLIATYDSMIQASNVTGIHKAGISRSCRYPHRSAKNFRFKYLKE